MNMHEDINIQWFPGHMTKARRMMSENLKLVDAVCEIIDARIPISSRNPDLDEITENKPRLIILNRVDQADTAATKAWATYFRSQGMAVLETDSKTGSGVKSFPAAVKSLLKKKIQSYEAKGQGGRMIRVMVAGIPNVGKSSFINRLAGRRAAQTSDRPGVTRGRQWIKIIDGLELLDTPGILWPKFDNKTVGENLAFTGAVNDDVVDREALAANLMLRLFELCPDKLAQRYKISPEEGLSGHDILSEAARKRGFLLSGGVFDTERMAIVLLDEFRGGKLGRVTLERPPALVQ